MSTSTEAPVCPRCQQGPLVDPNGLGWCKACGYCRSLEEERAKDPPPEAAAGEASTAKKTRPSVGGLVELGEAVYKLPSWVWVLLAGMAGFALVSLLPSKKLPLDSLERAVWCTLQIAMGLLLILAAQFWAVIQIAPHDERVSARDVLLPARLWGLVFKRMPAMRLPVWFAGWGLSLILSAVLIIGGLSYWMNYLPGSKAAQQKAGQVGR
jgi:hypothetical protein